MRLHRFFIETQIEHTKFSLKDEKLIHQWRDVFRYNIGSEVILFDGSGNEFDAVIEKMNNREAELRIVSERKGIVPSSHSTGSGQEIILCQSLIKKDKMEWIVEKATELGVSKILPVISERSEKKNFNLERAKKIAIEASEQCGRADVPEISEILNLREALDICENMIIFDPIGTPLSFLNNSPLTKADIFIGPEGGWTEKELEMFSALGGSASGGKQKGSQVFSLGPLILRAETAAVVALAVLRFQKF